MVTLVLEFHSKGLRVTGDTYDLRELLKSIGGRWDAALRGWFYPFDGKQDLLSSVREGCGAKNLTVRDKAKVTLTLAVGSEKTLVITGETFPVKDFLKEQGGSWNPSLKSWVFKRSDANEFAEILRSFPDVGCVDLNIEKVAPIDSKARLPENSKLVVYERPVAAPVRNSLGKSKEVDYEKWSTAKLKDKLQELQVTSSGKKPALIERLRKCSEASSCKVVEKGKRVQQAQQRADGTKTNTQTDKRERKLSCKKTGAHIQTASVTRKRKVVETKDKIVETKTIVLKRVRSKKQER
jgi:hypothetical protein